jgi:hypothetical protein
MNIPLSRLAARRRAYADAFASDAGRRVLRDLHRFCMRPPPTADPHEAVFAMGMQRVYRRIEAMMRLDADAAFRMTEPDEETDDA